MPSIITAGAFSARGFGFAGRAAAASFIGGTFIAHTTGSPSVPITFPAGTAAGDVAFIYVYEGRGDTVSITGGAGGWVAYRQNWGSGELNAVFAKQLASGDVAGVTVTANGAAVDGGAPIVVLVYRGASTVTLKSSGTAFGAALSLAGITKASLSRGLVSIFTVTGNTTPGYPSGFTSRTGGNSSLYSAWSADLLNTPLYVNGTAVAWSSSNSTNLDGYLFELT